MASPSPSSPASTSTSTVTDPIPSSKQLRHATPAQLQAAALQKLLRDTSKPVHIPSAPKEGVKQLRAPREMMRNVQGSSAGAGSGEFHVYKESRRREYERLKLMDEEEAYNKAKQDALERQALYEAQAEAKTAKNRLKRQKKKQAHRSSSSAAGGNQGDQTTPEKEEDGVAMGDKKRKLGSSAAAITGSGAGAGSFKFKSAKERANGDDEDEDEENERINKGEDSSQGLETINNGVFVQDAITVPQVAPAKEPGVKIVDDDDF
ncbi:BQ2448_1396 [Microbotryum intermedium]|uniref:BQ2448_1396 protein n=1 Tax=Microbotryum intermedium TaxID=269621 RepID=A0A238F808_9BASI|nr:BQ2448_1396 [Microbotryum intermedium]